jgi:pilus assembly protein CpaB
MLVALGIALVLATVVSTLVYRQLSHVGGLKAPIRVGKIVVAAEALPSGTRLDNANLREIDWSTSAPLAGAFARPEDCADRTLLVSVVENEPILEANLAPREAGVGLPAVIPKGMRAVSVGVNDVVDVSGFVQPGSLVDVLATGSTGGQNSTNVTRTVLQGIRVLAAGQRVEPDKEGHPQTVPVVTLLVSPDEANVLTMASLEGRIQLALRNALDAQHVATSPVEQAWLFGGAPAPVSRAGNPRAALAAPPRSHTIEVIRGGKREMETLPNP